MKPGVNALIFGLLGSCIALLLVRHALAGKHTRQKSAKATHHKQSIASPQVNTQIKIIPQIKVPPQKKLPPECNDMWLRTPMEYDSVIRYFQKKAINDYQSVLVTQCTVDRLDKLERQARSWGGPVSVAVYIPTDTFEIQNRAMKTIDEIVTRLDKDATLTSALTVSILFGLEKSPWRWNCTEPEWEAHMPLYPVNALRNLAVAATSNIAASPEQAYSPAGNTTSPLLFLVDVDFVPSAGLADWLHQQITLNTKSSEAAVIATGDAIVIPAFEANFTTEFPRSGALTQEYMKQGLREEYAVTPFHVQDFKQGHGPTNYTRWKELLDADEPVLYLVRYEERYEPYVIISRDYFIPYDERFRGYGLNKVVQLRWLSDCGTRFHVLSKHFVAAKAHERSATFTVTFGAHMKRSVQNVYALYNNARGVLNGGIPALSSNTEVMLRANGLQYMLVRCANRTSV